MKEYESREDMLKDLVKPGSTLAEIGVFAADFSEWMAKTLQPKKLYGVDPYTSTIGFMGSGNVDGFGMEHFENDLLHGFVKTRMSAFPQYEHRRVFSGEFFNSLDDGSLDAVYIDGDHSHDAVRNDLELARHAVKEGGWICGHDYEGHPTKSNPELTHYVKPVVDEFCQKYGLSLHAIANDGVRSFAIQNIKKYKICIVSVSDRPPLYTRTFTLIDSYAKQHGYDTRLFTEILEKERHPSWSKIPALGLAIQESLYDFIVWMDDDIVITNPEIPLSHFIEKYNFRKNKACLLVSGDIPEEPSTCMNCGILFLKAKEQKTSNLLSAVWKHADDFPLLKQHLSWEQEAFNFFYRFTERDLFQIIPLPNFQASARFQINPLYTWKPGYFSAHLNNGPLPIKLMTFDLLAKLCKF
jgi:hypothetical protein